MLEFFAILLVILCVMAFVAAGLAMGVGVAAVAYAFVRSTVLFVCNPRHIKAAFKWVMLLMVIPQLAKDHLPEGLFAAVAFSIMVYTCYCACNAIGKTLSRALARDAQRKRAAMEQKVREDIHRQMKLYRTKRKSGQV
jgi:hypothetical protein